MQSSRVEMVKIGPWGGDGGQPRDVDQERRPSQLSRVIVYSKGQAINAISFEYIDTKGERVSVPAWGGSQGIPVTTVCHV